jgi:hypothetical protein
MLTQLLATRGLGAGYSFKASNKPSMPKQETWEQAVSRLVVSSEEKARLLAFSQEETR